MDRDINYNKRDIRLTILLIVAVTFLIYANSLGNGFVRDDYIVIVDNEFIKSWKNLPLLFNNTYLPSLSDINSGELISGFSSAELTYRPLVTLSYFLDYSMWGLRAFGYHFMNLILHASNAVLLFIFVFLLSANKKIALLTSLLFATHPVNAEVVNTISFRADLLSFLFFISCLIVYIKSFSQPATMRMFSYGFSLLIFLLALFSKEMAITLPLILIWYDWCFVFKGRPKEILSSFKSRYLAYFLILFFYLWVWGFLMKSQVVAPRQISFKFEALLFTLSIIIAQYLQWVFVPLGLHVVLNSDKFIVKAFNPQVGLAILLILLFFVLALRISRRSRAALFSIGWFFITLLPVINPFLLKNLVSARYLYIPIGGLCFLFSLGLFNLQKTRPFKILPKVLNFRTLAAVILIAFLILTTTRNRTWKDEMTFWSALVNIYPADPAPHIGIGNGFLNKGLIGEAVVEFQRALELNPGSPAIQVSLGNAFAAEERYAEAIFHFKQAIELDKRYMLAHHNLGITYILMEDFDQASKVWEKALETNPTCKIIQDDLAELDRLGLKKP